MGKKKVQVQPAAESVFVETQVESNNEEIAPVVQFASGATSIINTASIQKLNGKNFLPWRRQVMIVLELRKLDQAIQTDLVSKVVQGQATLVLLETMDDSHKLQVSAEPTARLIMKNLERQYANQSEMSQHRMLSNFFGCKKVPEDNFNQHVNRLKEMRAALMNLGQALSDEVFQVTLINSLPKEFGDVMRAWELVHPTQKNLEFLLNYLQQRDEDIKKEASAQALLVEQKRQAGSSRGSGSKLSIEERKKISKCNVCQNYGHWAKDKECPRYKASDSKPETRVDELGKKDSANVVRQVNFNVGSGDIDLFNSWIIDSGATSHMANSKKYFCELSLYDTPKECASGDGSMLKVLGEGKVRIRSKVDGEIVEIVLNKVLFMPELAANLISVGIAADQGATAIFTENQCKLIIDNQVVAIGARLNAHLYMLSLEGGPASEECALLVKGLKTMTEFHRAFGHAGPERVKALLKQLGRQVPANEVIDCPDCPAGKGKHSSHPSVGRTPASSPGVVHVDLGVVLNKVSLDGFKYYLVCKDEFSEFSFVYPCEDKSKVPKLLAQMVIDFEILSGLPVQQVYSDNGSEFKNDTTEALWLKEGIKHCTSAPYCPQQNGKIEREIRSITESARTILIASGLPLELWPEALHTAVYVKNRMPTSSNEKTPFERLIGRKATIDHIVEFGRAVHILVNDRYLTKWDPRTVEGFIVGFTQRRNTYQVYVPDRRKVVVSCDVIFASHKQASKRPEDSKDAACELITIDMRSSLDTLREETNEDSCGDDLYVTTRQSPPRQSTPERDLQVRGSSGKALCTGEALDRFFEQVRMRENVGGNLTVDELDESSEFSEAPTPPPRLSSFQQSINNESANIEGADDGGSHAELPPQLVQYNTSAEGDEADKGSVYLMLTPPAISEPASYREAMSSPNVQFWTEAIATELEAHRVNKTWSKVKRPPAVKPLSVKWVFTIKRDADGTPTTYKARCVARGFEQKYGVDFVETFAPVAKVESLRTLLALAAVNGLHIVQFDVSTAFLNGVLTEDVYIEAPDGYSIDKRECLKLNRSLYGLKQAPKCWNSTFDSAIKGLGMAPTLTDPCVYFGRSVFVIIYVDDGLIIGQSNDKCRQLLESLQECFRIKELSGHRFLGMDIEREGDKIRLSQKLYIRDILTRFNMNDSNGVSTPITTIADLMQPSQDVSPSVPYRQAIGSLQYLASRTRPDIMFAVNFLSRFNQSPKRVHWTAVKRVMKYLICTQELGIIYGATKPQIIAYSDADYANDVYTRQSVSGILVLFGGGPVCFSSTRQGTVAQSSAEAEFIAANEAAKEIAWISSLLTELSVKFDQPLLRIDNKPAIRQIQNGDTKKRSKHVDIKYHYIRQQYQLGSFILESVPTEKQLADFLTKPIGPAVHLVELLKASNMGSKAGLSQPVSKLALLLSTLLATCSANYQYQPASPIVFTESDYRIENGIQVGFIDFSIISPCDLLDDKLESVYDVRKLGYNTIKDLCQKVWLEEVAPTFEELKYCINPRPTPKHHIKKRAAPLILAIAALATTVVGGSGASGYSYWSPSSSYNRLNAMDQKNEERDALIKDLKEKLIAAQKTINDNALATNLSIQEARSVRNDTLSVINLQMGHINENRKAIIQLSSTSAGVAWDAGRLNVLIFNDKLNLEQLIVSCRKGKFNAQALYKIVRIPDLKDINEENTFLESVTGVGANTINFKFTVAKEPKGVRILEAKTLNHWVGHPHDPKFLKWIGSRLYIYNTTNDCLRIVDEMSIQDRRVYSSCSEAGFVDPALQNSWVPADKPEISKLIQPVVLKTGTESYIQCWLANITIENQLRLCPPYPFRIPIHIDWSLNGTSHDVSKIVLHLKGRVVSISKLALSNATDNYDATYSYLRDLQIRNERSGQMVNYGIDSTKGVVTIPLPDSNTVWTWISVIGGIVTVGGAFYRCIKWFVNSKRNRSPDESRQTHIQSEGVLPANHTDINFFGQPQPPPHLYPEVPLYSMARVHRPNNVYAQVYEKVDRTGG